MPIVVLVMFTLYGIDGIGMQLEDPFGYDRNDIKMDAIVEDMYVFSESIFPVSDETLSLETCTRSLYSENMFQGSTIP